MTLCPTPQGRLGTGGDVAIDQPGVRPGPLARLLFGSAKC